MTNLPALRAAPKLLFIVTEDWFFASHFLPMARAARRMGLDVIVATQVDRHRGVLEQAGVRVIPVATDRRSGFAVPQEVARLVGVLRHERPDIVHCIALRSIIAGGLAGRVSGVRRYVLAPTGLGHLWISRGRRAAFGRAVIKRAAAWLRGPGTVFLFENADDPAELGVSTARGDRIAFVGGAGVDGNAFPARPIPPDFPPLRLAFVGRMLWPKGAGLAVEAVRLARARGVKVTLDLFGAPDRSNPDAIPEQQLEAWGRAEGISWHGAVEDVPRVWSEAHAGLLPTYYREGIPRALIEAMACGRAVITTNVPGCRDAVRDGIEGLLVPPRDATALAGAIAALTPDRLGEMGAAARRRFEERYTEEAVMAAITGVYRDLLAVSPPAPARR
ncbi:MAG: glycosyltransferase family 4 protein [Bauldia sp.]|nr:glycosyltransferase family 4 protein [Bauldia sp.]